MSGFGSVVIYVLVAALLAVGVVMAVGYRRRIVDARREQDRRWRPPYVSGRELYSWARSIAEGIVSEVVEAPDGATSGEVTRGLSRGAARAMLPGARSSDLQRAVACPREGQGVIRVSAVEAIQIADYLRKRLRDTELRRLRDQCKCNAAFLAWPNVRRADLDPCALQGDECLCVAYPERPLACRPLHAAMLARELDVDLTNPGDTSHSIEEHMELVGLGIVDGLAEGLEGAGLDANRYELHSALAVALEHPDAAVRWAAGEDVFAGCHVPVARTSP